MRVLLDSCVPQRLRHAIQGHEVETAQFAGLEGLSDGELLAAMEGRFDILLTCDQGIPWQQDVSSCPFSIIILTARTNRLPDLLPLVSTVMQIVAEARPGEIYIVGD